MTKPQAIGRTRAGNPDGMDAAGGIVSQDHGFLFPTGEDRLIVSAYVKWTAADPLFEQLETRKKARQETNRDDNENRYSFHGINYYISGHGTKPSSDGPAYRWQVKGDGCTWQIAATPEPKGTTPNVLIDVGSIALMIYGIDEMWRRARLLIGHLGGYLTDHAITRIDLCCDVTNRPISEITNAILTGYAVKRPRKLRDFDNQTHHNGGHVEGMTIGRGNCVARIYDKLAETAHQPEKRAALISERWEGTTPRTAYRVEFQLRRQWLREAHRLDDGGELHPTRTIDNWLANRSAIAAYLTQAWLRVTTEKVDQHEHYDRIDTDPTWERIGRSLANGYYPPAVRQRDYNPDPLALIQQACGCLVKASIVHRKQITSKRQLLAYAQTELTALLAAITDKEFEDAICAKRATHELQFPTMPVESAA